jgi:hypothetical protein
MKGTGATFLVILGCLLLLIAFCSGALTFTPLRDGGDDAATFAIRAGSGLVTTVILAAALYCFREAFRALRPDSAPVETGPTPAVGYQCPRCGSSSMIKLAPNEISPWRELQCEGCGARLANPAGRHGHAVVAVVAGGFVAVSLVMTFVVGEWRLPLGLGGISVTVLIYCIRQLIRPAARRVR